VHRYQKGKTNLDFTEARDSEWQWHQLGTSLQTDNHASTSPLSFLQAVCPSCRPSNSIKALKAQFLSLPLQQNLLTALNTTRYHPGVARQYAPSLRQFDSSKNRGESTWWPAVAKLQASSVPNSANS